MGKAPAGAVRKRMRLPQLALHLLSHTLCKTHLSIHARIYWQNRARQCASLTRPKRIFSLAKTLYVNGILETRTDYFSRAREREKEIMNNHRWIITIDTSHGMLRMYSSSRNEGNVRRSCFANGAASNGMRERLKRIKRERGSFGQCTTVDKINRWMTLIYWTFTGVIARSHRRQHPRMTLYECTCALLYYLQLRFTVHPRWCES